MLPYMREGKLQGIKHSIASYLIIAATSLYMVYTIFELGTSQWIGYTRFQHFAGQTGRPLIVILLLAAIINLWNDKKKLLS
jgi:uncharacterized integral membrane protein